jgi:hypothetical protein
VELAKQQGVLVASFCGTCIIASAEFAVLWLLSKQIAVDNISNLLFAVSESEGECDNFCKQ